MQFLIIFSLGETNVEKGPRGALTNCSGTQPHARFPSLNISRKEQQDLHQPGERSRPGGIPGKGPMHQQTPAAAKPFTSWQWPVSAPPVLSHPPAAAGCRAEWAGGCASPGDAREVVRAGQAPQGAQLPHLQGDEASLASSCGPAFSPLLGRALR